MKLFKNTGKRALSLLIAVMMCVSMMPMSAFAADDSPSEDAAVSQETAVSTETVTEVSETSDA